MGINFYSLYTGNLEESRKYMMEFSQLAPVLMPVNWLSCGGDEFLVGRAGYLAGLLWLRSELGCEVRMFLM